MLLDCIRIMRLDPDALALLGKYGVRSCLIERSAPLCTLLNSRPEWQRVYQDDLSVIFARDTVLR